MSGEHNPAVSRRGHPLRCRQTGSAEVPGDLGRQLKGLASRRLDAFVFEDTRVLFPFGELAFDDCLPTSALRGTVARGRHRSRGRRPIDGKGGCELCPERVMNFKLLCFRLIHGSVPLFRPQLLYRHPAGLLQTLVTFV